MPSEPETGPREEEGEGARWAAPGSAPSPPPPVDQGGWGAPSAATWSAAQPPGAPSAPTYARAWGPSQPKAGSVRTGPLPLHPMNLGDILDGAFKLFKANAQTVVVITLVLVGPIQVFTAWLQRGALGIFDLIRDPPPTPEAFEEEFAFAFGAGGEVALILTWVLSLLVLPYVAGAVSRVVGESYLGHETRAWPALRATLRRWWSLLAAWVIVHLIEGAVFLAGLVLLVVGAAAEAVPLVVLGVLVMLAGIPAGLVLMGFFVAVAPAIVMEDLGPVAGVRRSVRLIRPRFFPVLGIALLSGLLASVISSVLGFVPMFASFFLGSAGWPLLAAGGLLSNLVALPFVAIVSTLVYFDGRIRQEGFDLEVVAGEMRHAPAGRR